VASDGPPGVGFLAHRMWVTAQRAWDLTSMGPEGRCSAIVDEAPVGLVLMTGSACGKTTLGTQCWIYSVRMHIRCAGPTPALTLWGA